MHEQGKIGKLLFFNEAARAHSINRASEDDDLVAFHELKIKEYTDRVSMERADELENYDRNLLYEEVQDDYGLNDHDFTVALTRCIKKIVDNEIA